MAVTYRSIKGQELTHEELDNNWNFFEVEETNDNIIMSKYAIDSDIVFFQYSTDPTFIYFSPDIEVFEMNGANIDISLFKMEKYSITPHKSENVNYFTIERKQLSDFNILTEIETVGASSYINITLPATTERVSNIALKETLANTTLTILPTHSTVDILVVSQALSYGDDFGISLDGVEYDYLVNPSVGRYYKVDLFDDGSCKNLMTFDADRLHHPDSTTWYFDDLASGNPIDWTTSNSREPDFYDGGYGGQAVRPVGGCSWKTWMNYTNNGGAFAITFANIKYGNPTAMPFFILRDDLGAIQLEVIFASDADPATIVILDGNGTNIGESSFSGGSSLAHMVLNYDGTKISLYFHMLDGDYRETIVTSNIALSIDTDWHFSVVEISSIYNISVDGYEPVVDSIRLFNRELESSERENIDLFAPFGYYIDISSLSLLSVPSHCEKLANSETHQLDISLDNGYLDMGTPVTDDLVKDGGVFSISSTYDYSNISCDWSPLIFRYYMTASPKILVTPSELI